MKFPRLESLGKTDKNGLDSLRPWCTGTSHNLVQLRFGRSDQGIQITNRAIRNCDLNLLWLGGRQRLVKGRLGLPGLVWDIRFCPLLLSFSSHYHWPTSKLEFEADQPQMLRKIAFTWPAQASAAIFSDLDWIPTRLSNFTKWDEVD